MEREKALDILKSRLKNKNLYKHSLAVEICMKHLAQVLGEDEDKWALTGLLHDLDYEDTKDTFSRHGLLTAEILEREGLDPEIINAIKAHPGHVERDSLLAKALYAVDPLTGLIVAAALMHPKKRLEYVDTGFVLNRFKEKSFARGANREQIKTCEEFGFSLDKFIDICLKAMKEISKDLEL